ncbi:MAG TPA: flagellar biosynthesis anti-sigma factor FlgM [Terriglobales bacterium]|nr:flagellar biosynthesis anti-sigma factor FlgM [Terriglobales bacterium]
MRIHLTNSALQQVASAPTSRGSQPKTAQDSDTAVSTATADRAQFSFDGGHIMSLTARVLAAPEIREEKVASLAAALKSGQYTVDAGKVAGALVSAYS